MSGPFAAGSRIRADDLNTELVELVMDWTSIGLLGTYTAAGSPGSPAPEMRILRIHGSLVWEYTGRVNTTGITAGATVSVFTFNPDYRPTAERGTATFASNSAHYPARLAIMTSGALTVSVPTAAGATTSGVHLDALIIHKPR
ncbi:hypothetical protein ABZ714_19440 [Streptomyces sp. NPDC006798]|uniref:hypothetical protein n=1 Tax=Streptomyces sp. NPDC006798 TaxID=3155462 RepID=UPI003404939D